MLIGLDGIPLTELKTGVGHYTFELARALARLALQNEFELAYPSTYPPIDLTANEGSSSLPTNLKTARVNVGPLGRHWWSIGLPRYVRQRGIELFHGTNYDIPLRRRCPTVLTVHDLSLLTHPETHEKPRVRRARRRLRLMVHESTAIITPTESVRREVCFHLGVKPEKVFAVPEAFRDCFRPVPYATTEEVRRRFGIKGKFLLTVGTIEPRKNMRALVRAFANVMRRNPHPELQLVIAGNKGWLTSQFFGEVEQSGVADRILFTGYLFDDDLRALYSSCLLFVYPSIYEGFGLPPLEAMACGAPVIVSRIPTLVETTQGAAGYFDLAIDDDLTRAIVDLTTDDSALQSIADAGLKQAAKFSWEQTAQMTLSVYEEALRRGT
ncbi:MAG TPA: glycosyltransferase family 1 protein [Pyrinomonadaceae bacterium]|nr:glycosyltransferase family 1 protein [Pyrinomonadaceae bacterium]